MKVVLLAHLQHECCAYTERGAGTPPMPSGNRGMCSSADCHCVVPEHAVLRNRRWAPACWRAASCSWRRAWRTATACRTSSVSTPAMGAPTSRTARCAALFRPPPSAPQAHACRAAGSSVAVSRTTWHSCGGSGQQAGRSARGCLRLLVRAKRSATAARCRHPPYMQLGKCWLQVKCNLP